MVFFHRCILVKRNKVNWDIRIQWNIINNLLNLIQLMNETLKLGCKIVRITETSYIIYNLYAEGRRVIEMGILIRSFFLQSLPCKLEASWKIKNKTNLKYILVNEKRTFESISILSNFEGLGMFCLIMTMLSNAIITIAYETVFEVMLKMH